MNKTKWFKRYYGLLILILIIPGTLLKQTNIIDGAWQNSLVDSLGFVMCLVITLRSKLASRSNLMYLAALLMFTGLLLNFIVISANGGHMPVIGLTHQNHFWIPADETRLPSLSDGYWNILPAVGQFSIGDILLSTGLLWCIVIIIKDRPKEH